MTISFRMTTVNAAMYRRSRSSRLPPSIWRAPDGSDPAELGHQATEHHRRHLPAPLHRGQDIAAFRELRPSSARFR